MMRMRVSISVTDFSWRAKIPNSLAEIADAADDAGIDTVWVPDHLLQADPTAPADDRDMLEAYTTLGYLAARTERVRLGAMVSAVTFRPPALLVKAVTTLDVLTVGRAWLGVGAGYEGGEALAMGLSMPPTAERFERLEETLRIAVAIWAGDESRIEGKHYRLEHPIGFPLPVSQPHPPILVGGTGEAKTLRLVAQYADACNLFDIPDGGVTLRRKLDVLARHCDDVGRPFGEIEKTVSARLNDGESAESILDRCADFARFGIDHVVFIRTGAWSPDAMTSLASVIPRAKGLGIG